MRKLLDVYEDKLKFFELNNEVCPSITEPMIKAYKREIERIKDLLFIEKNI